MGRWGNKENFLEEVISELGFPGGANGKEPACQCRRHKEMWVGSWVGEDPLEEGLATDSRILA